jgi:hypothetical protein
MKTRKVWTGMVVAVCLAFTLQASTIAKAQDNGQNQTPDQNQPQDQMPGQDQVQGQDQDQDQNQDQNQDQAQAPAQEQDQDPSQDPPGRVARLDYSQGSVSFRPAGEDDWVTAVPNRPMVTGDDLWADDNSRAEVHVGSAAIRLGPKSGITFLALDDRSTQIRLAQGSLILRVRHLDDDDAYEVDTPNIAFTVLQPGEYRIDVNQDGSQTITTVWHGRGRVTGGGFSYTVLANQTATFTGNEQHLDYDLGQIPRQDDFDSWAFDRDSREDRSDSANYVSREMTGYEDLDDNGDWSYVAGYGPCWRPRGVAVGWAPYRYGHWAFVGRWGWTWVEDEPWGFAPFHYGRWAYVNSGWFWVPGPVVVRPVWAPALVAFVGGGPGFRFSAGVGVGWFPLAPGEVFIPGYRVSRGYVNNVNITNTTVNITRVTNVYNTTIINRNRNVTNITYVNQHVNNGVTVVSHDTFVNARPVNRNIMRVDQRELVAAPVYHRMQAEPIRTSVIGSGRPVTVRPPAAIISRPVVAVRTPPAPQRPIEEREARAGGRLNEQMPVHTMAPVQPRQMNEGGRTQPPQEGFRPFSQPSQPNGGNPQVRPMPQTQPRVFEKQGTPQPENRPPDNRNVYQQENRPPAENRNMQQLENRSQPNSRPPQQEMRPPVQETQPLVRQAPPVQERNPQQEQQQAEKFHQWQQQRPASPPPQQHTSPPPQQHTAPPPARSEPPKQDKPKGH